MITPVLHISDLCPLVDARPITFNDRRILDRLSRERYIVNIVLWRMEGCTEVKPARKGARS